MKILHFLVTTTFSGAEHVVVDILNAFKDGNEVYYVSPEGPIRKTLEEYDIAYIPCNTDSIREIKRVYREIKPDIVHACDPRMSFKCALAGIPFVAHLHSNCAWMKKICANSVALLFTAIRAKAVIAVSESIRQEYIFSRLINGKLYVVENVVNANEITKKAASEKSEGYDLLYVGRLSPEKGPLEFLKTVKKVREFLPDTTAAMIGDGEMAAECEKFAIENGIHGVKFFGFMSNPYSVMAASKINLMPSKVEGFGLVAVECMLLATPVIAFSVGGLSEIVKDGTGVLCKNEYEMAEAAVKYLNDPRLLEMSSECAAANAKKFADMSAYTKKIKNIYLSMMK